MKRLTTLVAFAGVASAGCSGGLQDPSPGHATSRPIAAAVPASSSAEPVRARSLSPRVFGDAAVSMAQPTHVMPIEGLDGALFVRDFSNDPERLVRVFDATKNASFPVVRLGDEHVVGAYATEGGVHLLTTSGSALCASKLDDAGRGAASCVDTDATLVARLGDGFALLREDVPGLDDPDRKKKQREEARARPPERKPKARPKKSKPAEVRVKADPKKVELYAKRADASLATTGEWATTGLVYQTPLGGLGLVSAIGGPSRVRALYYEYGGPSREKSRDIIGEARLALGSLDETLKYDPASAHKMKLGKLYFGFVDEHQNPRLVGSDRGILYFGQTAMRGRCEVAVVSPFVMPLIPSQEDCALAPQRFFDHADAARAKQRNKPAPDIAPLDAAVRARTNAIRAYGQSASDPVRVAGFGPHQLGLTSEGVFVYAAGGAPTALDAPFAGPRDLVVSGAFAPDGSAYVETTSGDILLSSTHEVIARTPRVRVPRGDVELHERRAFSKVQGAWVPRRGRYVTRGSRSAGPVEADVVVVGGEARGLRLALRQGMLQVDGLSKGGALERLATFASPVTSGFDAAERPGGGALIVGTRPSGEVVAFTLGARGNVGPVMASGVKQAPHVSMRLTPFVNGGGVVSDETETTYLWLSDAARWLGSATAKARTAATCGVDPPSAFPLVTPGALTSSRAILGEGCYAGDFGFDASGTLLVLGEVREGVGRRAAIFPASEAAADVALAAPAASTESPAPSAVAATTACPSDMVHVPGTPAFCVDRYESSLLDAESSDFVSPDGPPTPNARAGAVGDFATRREIMGDLFARAFPLPDMRDAVVAAPGKLVAIAIRGGIPSGFVSGTNAKAACAAAGKRLCSRDEWKKACRGEKNTLFPYGDTFTEDACNVDGDAHPAALLHGHASMGHLDPRLNRVIVDGRTLLGRTGTHPRCASRFGDDAIFDMVGNLDEWIDDKSGAFAGGFYARRTQNGCEAIVDNHPNGYFDYSTGVRCCASL